MVHGPESVDFSFFPLEEAAIKDPDQEEARAGSLLGFLEVSSRG